MAPRNLSARLVPLLLSLLVAALPQPAFGQDDLAELEALLAEERAEAARLLRRGEWSEASSILDLHLEDEPEDWRSLGLIGRSDFLRARYDRAERRLTEALELGRLAAEPGSAGTSSVFERRSRTRVTLAGTWPGQAPRSSSRKERALWLER